MINFKSKCSYWGDKKAGLINKVLFIVFVAFLVVANSGCEKKKMNYQLVEVDNVVYLPNTEFQLYEDLSLPKFNHLIEKYQLDTLIKSETDEFQRMLILRHWIKSVIRIEDHSPHYSGNGFAEGILDAALQGEGFHCAHFMKVQNAIMNAYGYVTRVIGAGPGAKGGPDGNHGIDEIWSNKYGKWFLSDAKYDHHFEKDGIPLSALEVRDEYLKNKVADVVLVKGPNRTPIDFDQEIGFSKERFAQTYTWIKWYIYGNRYSIHPEKYNEGILVYQDDYYNNNIYYRDGVPVSQKALDWFIKVRHRDAIEWTPNVLKITAKISRDTLNVFITSDTPNLKEYQIKEDEKGQWRSTEAQLALNLSQEKHIWFFRSINLANVAGPEYKLVVEQSKL